MTITLGAIVSFILFVFSLLLGSLLLKAGLLLLDRFAQTCADACCCNCALPWFV